MAQVEDIGNRALRAIGVNRQIGWIYEGSAESRALLEVYGQTLRQLLRAAHWSFARRRSQNLTLLGDSTLGNPDVSSYVDPPWRYAYAWPVDCVRPRWLPWSGITPANLAASPGNIPLPGNPAAVLVPNLNTFSGDLYPYDRPARFLLSSSDQYPIAVGQQAPTALPPSAEGAGPINRRIILTNVQNAQLVYTYLALDVGIWDELFSQAFVATLASRVCLPLKGDPGERDKQIAIAKMAVGEARVASAQETGFPQSTDREASWTRFRRTGRGRWGSWGEWGWGEGVGPGYSYCGWESIGWSDGSVY
jgi:hypothetical protein